MAPSITALFISIQFSLPLSLGLLGALSIIRFRTPVKEAEELVYLFIAIAIGLGIGADRIVATVVVVAALLAYAAASARLGPARRYNRTLIQVHIPGEKADGRNGENLLQTLLATLEKHAENVDLRRVDLHAEEFNANALADTRDAAGVSAMLGALREALPGATVSVIDREILE